MGTCPRLEVSCSGSMGWEWDGEGVLDKVIMQVFRLLGVVLTCMANCHFKKKGIEKSSRMPLPFEMVVFGLPFQRGDIK